MKIAKIDTYIVSDTLDTSFFFSQWRYSERKICLVKITTDSGTFGWGEGYGPAQVLKAGIELLAPLLLGKDPLQQEALWNVMYRKTLDFARRGILVSSISALDIALWDIKGKALNVPIHTLLGGAFRQHLKPYATGLYFSDTENLVQSLVQEAESYVSQGFKAIKMKVGFDLETDVHHVKAVRKAIGPDIELMIDANHAYSFREARKLAERVEPYEIGWFEEPVSPEFYHHYRALRQETRIPIAGGECEYLRYGFLQLLKNDCVDILQVDICGAGGLSEAKKIAALASSYGVEIVPHTWGTGIALHAAMHFIANLEPIPGRIHNPDFLIEYDRTDNRLREKLVLPSISMHNGYLSVPQNPGLGIEVDEEALTHFSESRMNLTSS